MVKRKTHKKRRLVYKKRRLTRNKKRKLTRTIQHGGLSSEEIKTLSQDPYVQLYVNFIFNRENFNNFILNTSITKRASDTVDFLKIIHTHTDIKKFKKEINYENGWVILLNEINSSSIFLNDWWNNSNLISEKEKTFLNTNVVLTTYTTQVLNIILKNKNNLIKPNSPPDLVEYYKIIYVRIILGIDTDFNIKWNEGISTIINNAYAYAREHTPPPYHEREHTPPPTYDTREHTPPPTYHV